MALQPMLVIGCGGSGGKVVAGMRRRLEHKLRGLGWDEGIPEAWQLLYVDTPSSQEVHLQYGPPVPGPDYISTAQNLAKYHDVDAALVAHAKSQGQLDRLLGWRPAPDLPLAVHLGAGQWRGVGRAVGFKGLSAIGNRISQAVGSFAKGQAQLHRLGKLMGQEPEPGTTPFVIVVSSMAGGTGAGIFIDVCDVVRTVDPELSDLIMGVLFTAEVFKNIGVAPGLQPNTVGALSEMMAGYFHRGRVSDPMYQGLVHGPSQQRGGSGPSYPFVVGMSTVNGIPLNDVSDCYRVVTETLVAAMTSPRIYDSLLQYQVTNWHNHAKQTSWGFGHGQLEDGGPLKGGMLSSFGSARLSVGSDLFGEYAVARLTREVAEFLVDGWVDLGKEMMRDPQATADQILSAYEVLRGLAFVESCGLRELDKPDEECNQVQDALLAPGDIVSLTQAWLEELRKELAPGGKRSKNQWRAALEQLLPLRRPTYLSRVNDEIDRSLQQLVAELPQTIATQTAQVMFELGVPVAKTLLKYLKTHIDSAALQLKDQRNKHHEEANGWLPNAMAALAGMSDRDEVNVDAALVIGKPGQSAALRNAASLYGMREVYAQRAARTADLLKDLSNDVVGPLLLKLDQIAEVVAKKDAREQWTKFPDRHTIPSSYRPTPFDFCLISDTTWVKQFDELREETIRREPPENQVRQSGVVRVSETVRRMVGGGDFAVTVLGMEKRVPGALTTSTWERGKPLQFAQAFEVADILERARVWAERPTTPMGDFIAQKLDSYLAPSGADGQPIVDHPKRLARFQDLWSNALKAATPLVELNDGLRERVHGADGWRYEPLIEPIPLSGDARRIATEVLTGYLTSLKGNVNPEDVEKYFTDTSVKVDGILIGSQLPGAVHPSVLTSVTQPIAGAWNSVKGNPASISTFWQYRVGRVLPEFIAVSPQARDALVKGWFVGRMMGVIPDPTESDGFSISYMNEIGQAERARFPWPLLRNGKWGKALAAGPNRREWLPALLESVGLAYTLFPTEPGILAGYEQMYIIGASPVRVQDWLRTGSDPAAVAPPQAKGGTPDERREDALRKLEKTKKEYHDELGTRYSSEPASFFGRPYGLSLFPDIVGVLEGLIEEVSSISLGDDEDVIG